MTPLDPTTLIRKQDSDFADLDFTTLRREGLAHLGRLSGKIWTDHNLHDPGITILEVLIYALVDLGYRTRLPIEDLLARPANVPGQRDDNFFTPAQILTNNPLTVVDQRKALMELDGVRNAWLEVAVEPDLAHSLNGLYRIYIEPEFSPVHADRLRQRVYQQFCRYRNLCEDVSCENIIILDKDEIAVCADLDLTPFADAAQVQQQVIAAIDAYFSPSVTYHSLNDLLTRGRPIEAIFAGRPLSDASFGFIDTDELNALDRRTTVYRSDLYNRLGQIDGVRGVTNLRICRCTDKKPLPDPWVLPVLDNHVPVLDMACSRFSFTKDGVRTPLTATELTGNGLPRRTRRRLPAADLNSPIPTGTYRPDLADYRSVQLDMPRVYGVGADGLPETATLRRRADARQLKGYLTFFDQLLANYLSQLAHVRELFSMTPDSQRNPDVSGSYFAQPLTSVPLIGELVRFYEPTPGLTEGTPLATPISARHYADILTAHPDGWRQPLFPLLVQDPEPVPRRTLRDLLTEQLQADFEQSDVEIVFHKDRDGHFFILIPASTDAFVLLSPRCYSSRQEATEQADQLRLLGRTAAVYRHRNQPQAYSFELVYRPTDYVALLQSLLERPDHYQQRRGLFLDHLLARFAETFTDYTLLVVGSQPPKPEQSNEAKARFLGQYDTLSRNRGRAFNYRRRVWRTNNRSGFEQRALTMAGIATTAVHLLCPFEVYPEADVYRAELHDERNVPILVLGDDYASESDAHAANAALLDATRDPNRYETLSNPDTAVFTFGVRVGNGLAQPPTTWRTADDRDAALLRLQRQFRTQATDEDIVVSARQYTLALQRATGRTLVSSQLAAESEADARDQLPALREAAAAKGVDLIPIPDQSDTYLNRAAFVPMVSELPLRYRWLAAGTPLFSSDRYATPDEALHALTQAFAADPTKWPTLLERTQEAYRWQIKVGKTALLSSTDLFRDTKRTLNAYRSAAGQLARPGALAAETGPDGERTWTLRTDTGQLLATVAGIPDNEASEAVQAALSGSKPTTRRVSEAYGYQLFDDANRLLLRSYNLFATPDLALIHYWRMTGWGRDATHYYLSGDEENLNFSFLLRDGATRYAEHPQTYERATDREQALNTTLAWLDTHVPPLQIVPDAAEYTYEYRPGDTVLLAADEPYATPDAAEAGFYQDLLDQFDVPDSPLIDRLVAERYSLQVTGRDHRFRFRHWQGDTPTYLSPTEYTAKSRAKAAYQAYVKQHTDGATAARSVAVSSLAAHEGRAWTYRVYRHDEPLAYHPEKVWDTDPADWHQTARKPTRTLFERELTIRELCLGGGDVVGKRERYDPITRTRRVAYHYVLREQQTHRALLTSFRSYASPDEAEAAFHADYLWLIGYASDPCNYVVFSEQQGYRPAHPDCAPTTHPTISLTERYADDAPPRPGDPWAVVPAAEWANVPNTEPAAQVANWFNGYPIRARLVDETPVYRFRVSDPTSRAVVWQSYADYPTPAEAMAAFRAFRQLLRYEGNFRPVEIDGSLPHEPTDQQPNCCIFIAIGEVLLDSAQRYGTKDEAWGAIEAMLAAAQLTDTYLERPLGQELSFGIGACVAQHPYVFDTPAECQQRIDELVNQCQKLDVEADENTFRLYCEAFTGETEYDDSLPFGCKPPAQRAVQDKLIWESCPADQPDPKRAIALANNPANYLCRPLNHTDCGPFVISLIDPERWLAVHPQGYDTPDDVAAAIDRTRACLNDEGLHLVEHILLRPDTLGLPQRPVRGKARQQPDSCRLHIEGDCTCQVCWTPDATEAAPVAYCPCTDPYSFWTTLVLPCWAGRFREAGFRALFENMLRRQAPAHLGLQIYWLKPKQFCEFEHTYRHWLTTLRYQHQGCPPQSGTLSCYPNTDWRCQMIQMLNRLTDDCRPASRYANQDDCPCLENKDQTDPKP